MLKKYILSGAIALVLLSALPLTAMAASQQEDEKLSSSQQETPWWEESGETITYDTDGTAHTDETEELDDAQQAEETSDPIRSRLNAATLQPRTAASGQLQQLVNDIVDDITTADMDTYEKVRACYDYLTANVQYGSHMRRLSTPVGETTCASIYSAYGELEGFGAVALTARTGYCNAYASAFILLTQTLGLDGHLVTGQTGSARGGYAYHEWAEIDIGDDVFVFDPQLEQNLVKAGLPAYTVFCRTYDEIPGRYIRSSRKV